MKLVSLVPPCRKCEVKRTVLDACVTMHDKKFKLWLHLLCVICGDDDWFWWKTDGLYLWAIENTMGETNEEFDDSEGGVN